MDGPWQMGHKTADEYGRVAREAAAVMKLVDPTIELVACGSSGSDIETFGMWETSVLDHCYDNVDYLSLHRYHFPSGDPASLLAQSIGMDDHIRSVVALCDAARARTRAKKHLDLAFDEWNVWHLTAADLEQTGREPWSVAPPLFETPYTLVDAVAVGLMLITLLRHADRVKIACMAQLVNTIAPITTQPGGPAFRQSIFYPYLHVLRFGRGTALDVQIRSPHYDDATYGAVPFLDAVAVLDEAQDTLTIFGVNRSLEDSLALDADLHGFGRCRVVEHLVLEHAEPTASNTAQHPHNVVPHSHGGREHGGRSPHRDPAAAVLECDPPRAVATSGPPRLAQEGSSAWPHWS